jgi:hypothetical protein
MEGCEIMKNEVIVMKEIFLIVMITLFSGCLASDEVSVIEEPYTPEVREEVYVNHSHQFENVNPMGMGNSSTIMFEENGTLNMTLELSGFFHEPLLWEQGMVNYSLIYNNETVFSVEINKSIENFNFTLTNFTGNITIQINSSGSDDPTDNNPGDFYIAKTKFEIIN